MAGTFDSDDVQQQGDELASCGFDHAGHHIERVFISRAGESDVGLYPAEVGKYFRRIWVPVVVGQWHPV